MKRQGLTFVLATLTGLTGPALAETVRIDVAPAPSIYQAAYEAVAAAFERTHPQIMIDLAPAVREDEELVQRTLREAIVGKTPDVLFVSPVLMRPLVDRRLAVPLAELGATPAALSSLGLVEGVTRVGEVSGTLYGLPLGVSTPVVVYNADLVRRAGGDPDHFPATWPETTALVGRIGALGRGVLGGFFEYDNTSNWTYKALVATLGGRMMDASERTVAFDGPEGREAFAVLRAFGEAGQGRADMTRDQARQAFVAGTIGVLITSSGALAGLERQVAGKFPLKAAPLPTAGTVGKVPAAGEVVVVLAKDPAKRAAAWQFAQFVVGVEAQTLIGQKTGLVSVNREALADPARLGQQLEARPNQKAAIDQLSRLTDWYAFPGENTIRITQVIRDYLQQVLTLKRPPEEALAAMKRDVEALLPK